MQSTRSSQRWLRGFFLVILAGAPALAASAEPPAITSLNPDAARAGGAEFSLTIHGENFTPASTAAFGANDLTTAFVSATELVAAIPASLIAGAGAFSVTVRTGGGASAGATFTVHPPEAAITGLSTAIRTASFVFSTRAGALRAVRPPAPPPVAITSQSSASAAVNTNVTTPISSSANLPSAANSNNTSDSLSMSFVGAATPTFAFVTGVPPAITSLTPASVLSSSGAFTMTINGANFISGKNASVARWNYTALATNYVSSSQLTAIVPASVISAGAVNITVVTSSGTSPSFGFTVNLAPPVITTESPSKLYVNNGAFMLYVYGNYFTSSAVVNWGGTPLTTTQIGGGSLTAIVPASLMATAGSVSITVSTAGGTSNSISFNVMALPPTITSLSPASVAAGSAQFSLTVNGTNFTPNSTSLVRLGTAYLGTTYVSATQLKGLVTASMMTTAGTVNVAVIQGGGVTSMAFPFTINPAPPKVSTLTPSSITAGGAGFMLNLTGSVFTPAATVLWGSTPLGTIYVSPTQLIASVPASLVQYSGSGSITVTTATGTSAPAAFTINPAPPAISGLYPSVALVGGAAFTMTINGAYFTPTSIAIWGSTALATTYINSIQLTAAVPANLLASAGLGIVTVTTSAGTSPPASFAIYSLPRIITATLPSGTAGSAYSGPIHVTGGVPGYAWTVTGLPASLSYYNSSDSTLFITGTPAAPGAISFQVFVQDSVGATAGPVSYTINVADGPSGANNGALNGSYACLLQGSIDDDGTRWATVASFQADGQGNFSGGVFDTNSYDVGSASGILTGSYNIGAGNNGLASIHTILTNNAAGIQTTQWALALSGNAQPAQHFRMVEADDLGTDPSGQQATANCYLATPSAFAASTLSGFSFAFGLDGENNDSNLKATVGQFSASNGAISGGFIDSSLGGSAADRSSAFSGSYTAPDPAAGRFTIALNGALNSTGFTVYIIDTGHMFILDNTSDDGEQAGNLRLQQQLSTTGATMSGPFVFYARGAEFNSGGSTPSGFYAEVLQGTGDGLGNMTINQSYANNAGVYSAGQSGGGPAALAFDPANSGRATFPTASGTTYLYFYNANSAFEMSVGSNGSVDSGWLETQSAAQTQPSFTNAALAGSYLFGELPLLSVTPTGYLGEYSLSASGAVIGAGTTSAEDLLSWDQSLSATYAWDATAPGTGGFFLNNGADGTASCVAVSAAKFVCAAQTDPAPSIQIMEQ